MWLLWCTVSTFLLAFCGTLWCSILLFLLLGTAGPYADWSKYDRVLLRQPWALSFLSSHVSVKHVTPKPWNSVWLLGIAVSTILTAAPDERVETWFIPPLLQNICCLDPVLFPGHFVPPLHPLCVILKNSAGTAVLVTELAGSTANSWFLE